MEILLPRWLLFGDVLQSFLLGWFTLGCSIVAGDEINMIQIVKDLGKLDVLDIECCHFAEGYKRCHIHAEELDPKYMLTLREKVDDVIMCAVDSVQTDGKKTTFLILEPVHCRIEQGSDEADMRNPDKTYLVCGKQPTGKYLSNPIFGKIPSQQ